MRALLTTCILLAVVIEPLYSQAPTIARNGFWWLAKSESERTSYVIGFMDGANRGRFIFGVAKSIKGNGISRSFIDYARIDLDYTGVRVGQLEDGLNDFYKDYKNESIHLDDAFGYVRDAIRGEDESHLAHKLEALRKLAVSPSYDSNN